MEVKEIIENFRYNNGEFQEDSILQARKNKEKVIPALLTELEEFVENIENHLAEENYMLHFYAMYLLAEFKEKRAFPIIINLLNKDQDILIALLGDMVTQGLDRILASTFDGDIKKLYKIIVNETLDEFIRSAAFTSLVILQKNNIIEQKTIENKIEDMLNNELKEDYSYVIVSIVNYIADNNIYDKKDLVQKLYMEHRVDEMAIGGYDSFIDSLYGTRNYFESKEMIKDTIAELSYWACFNEKDENEVDYEKFIKEFIKINRVKNEGNKKTKEIGRNELCPCREW